MKKKGNASTIQDRPRKCLTEEWEILKRWTEYYSELYNHKANGDPSVPHYRRGSLCQDPEGNRTPRRPPDHRTSRSSGLAKTILQGTVKGGRRQCRQKKRWGDNIMKWIGLEFAKSQRAVENREKWRKLVVKSSAVPQRATRLRDKWSDVKCNLAKRLSLLSSLSLSLQFCILNSFSLSLSPLFLSLFLSLSISLSPVHASVQSCTYIQISENLWVNRCVLKVPRTQGPVDSCPHQNARMRFKDDWGNRNCV